MHRRLDMAEACRAGGEVALIDVLFFRIFAVCRLIQNRRSGGWVIDLVGAREGAPTKGPRTENPADQTSNPRIRHLDRLEVLTDIG